MTNAQFHTANLAYSSENGAIAGSFAVVGMLCSWCLRPANDTALGPRAEAPDP